MEASYPPENNTLNIDFAYRTKVRIDFKPPMIWVRWPFAMQESEKLTDIVVLLALCRIAGLVGGQPKRWVAIRLEENSSGRNMVAVLGLVCPEWLTAQVAKSQPLSVPKVLQS